MTLQQVAFLTLEYLERACVSASYNLTASDLTINTSSGGFHLKKGGCKEGFINSIAKAHPINAKWRE